MLFFLLAFLSIYTCMHAFVFVRTRVLLPSSAVFQTAFILFLILMIAAPLITRLLESEGHEHAARISAFLGYLWMAYVFLAFWGVLVLGVFELVLRAANFALGTRLPTLGGAAPKVFIAGLAMVVCAYGYFDAKSIRVERISVKTDKLPGGVDRVRIAQISDVHLGLIVRGERVKNILDKVEAENPDILVGTGDLMDASIASVNDHLSELFARISPKYGKFAVTGNHEVYAGMKKSVDALTGFGFTLLRGESTVVGGVMNIVGVDDPATGAFADEAALLSASGNGLFTLLLKHRPNPAEKSLGLFDLQLSGHAHRGQVFPFNFFTGLAHPMQDGFYELPKGSKLYTSRGSGTWGPPVRVLSPPEVTIIDVVSKR